MLSSASGTIANNGCYSNDRNAGSSELEFAADPATGGFFNTDYKKHEDLKEMLDSTKDSLKLEAMKRIIGMIAKGRDASELFPAVVKNVVSKNIEVKKLVYVYLVRYAEEQQDLALLSISTFQRALKDPNQLIRAGALRVLSSIRVSMIVPIVMLAIRDAAVDMSPYVRKTAAHAIPKLYSLDAEQKTELVDVIERLLADRTTLVVGSAVMAFEEVCPDRIDLIHRNYRKLCALLVDVDEWGQVVILNMLTRYARTQFIDPNLHDSIEEKSFYESSAEESSENESEEKPAITMNPDHRLLLRTARPLLQSRNASVVMAVVQLYHHAAPHQEVAMAVKALVRLLRSHTEVQSIVLHAIASISIQRKGLFEPYLKNFFVRTSDPTHIKILKLEILTNLATIGNVSMILCELQTYITSNDKKFVAASIQAIGRCACNIQEITDICLNGLVLLLSSKDEAVVAESVVVIKRLLQTQATEPGDIVENMARLLDSITVAQARAAILWLLGEHSQKVKNIAPDVLRKLAKTFVEEHDIVKLQVLNLAVKLWLTNHKQTAQLCHYVFSLARYDQSYDIRDRARFLRQFTISAEENNILTKHASSIFLKAKPAPQLQSRFKDREQFQLGSLSHYINSRASGYRDLPPFSTEPTSSSLRDVENEAENTVQETSKQKAKIFYSDTEEASSAAEYNSKESSSENSTEDSSSEISESEESNEESSDLEQSSKKANTIKSTDDEHSDDSQDSESDSDSSSTKSASTSSIESNKINTSNAKISTSEKPSAKNNLDLLLDFDDIPEITPVMTPSFGGFLTPINNSITNSSELSVTNTVNIVPPSYIPQKTIELLNRVSGHGLNVVCRFTRSPHLFSPKMVSVELTFTNEGVETVTDIRVGKKNLPPGISVHDFATIAVLNPGVSLPGTLGIDLNDSTQAINLEILSSAGSSIIQIKVPMGELIQSVNISEIMFLQEHARLKGMYEHSTVITLSENVNITNTVLKSANLALVLPETDVLRYAGQTLSSASLVLAVIKMINEKANVSVHCEKITVGSMLLNEICSSLRSSK